MPDLSYLSYSIERERVSNKLSNQEKHILYIFRLQGLVIPYQEDLKPPTQYYNVFENRTDFFAKKLEA